MAYYKITTLVTFFLFSIFSSAQCNVEELVTVCDMETVDVDQDGNPDGILNLYEVYNNAVDPDIAPGTGTWSIENSLSLALDSATGNVSLWEYKFSSAEQDVDYIFTLTTDGCGDDPAATITVELGSFSGEALPPAGATDVNFETCEGIVNAFEALVSNDVIPPPHINGSWEILSNTANINISNFDEVNGILNVTVDYQEGAPIVDKGTIDLRYTVPATTNCALDFTDVTISVVRQVEPGNASGLGVCEADIIAGNYSADINLRDDTYLLGEDDEGFWSTGGNDFTNEISDVFDAIINLENLYGGLIDARGIRFGSETFSYTYTVPQRSGVCVDQTAIIPITIYEELRPFSQNANNNEFCLEANSSVDLFSLIDFTEEDGISFVYPETLSATTWQLVSAPNMSGLSVGSGGTFNLSQNQTYITPGTYEFSYTVSASINAAGSPCPSESAIISIEVLPFDNAGEDTNNVDVCETEETIILTDLLDTISFKGAVVTTGTWTDDQGNIVDNNFDFPEIDEDTQFTLEYNTVHPVSGCLDSATLSFTLINEKSPGSVGESIMPDNIVKLCTDDLSIVLFDQLQNADTTGVWTGPNNYTSADHTGTFVFNDQTQQDIVEGIYTYTIDNGAFCTTVERVDISIEFVDPISLDQPIMEVYCKTDGSIDLETLLAANVPLTGMYRELDTAGALSGSVVNFTNLSTGMFNFEYELDNEPCGTPIQQFTIEVIDDSVPPSPGIAPTEPIQVCSDNLTINLFDQLGGTPSMSGRWSGPFGYASSDHIGEFNQNNQNLPILGPGVFRYTVGGGPCLAPIDFVEFEIVLVDPVQLGADVNGTFCKLEGGINLFTLLDTATTTTGTFTSLDADPSVLDAEGNVNFETLETAVYNFQYSVPNTAPCDVSSLNIELNIISLNPPTIIESTFCILDANRLSDIELEADGAAINFYENLQSENPIIDDPLLTDDAIYYVTAIGANDCESVRTPVEVTILNIEDENGADCPLEFQDGVSADGNGINDTFSLDWKNMDYDLAVAFPNYELEIYNRYGVVVFKGNSTTEEFSGNSNVSLSIGDDLPSGTYFYIFKPNFLNNPPVQGSFYLSK